MASEKPAKGNVAACANNGLCNQWLRRQVVLPPQSTSDLRNPRSGRPGEPWMQIDNANLDFEAGQHTQRERLAPHPMDTTTVQYDLSEAQSSRTTDSTRTSGITARAAALAVLSTSNICASGHKSSLDDGGSVNTSKASGQDVHLQTRLGGPAFLQSFRRLAKDSAKAAPNSYV
jgi:hypothetical protein